MNRSQVVFSLFLVASLGCASFRNSPAIALSIPRPADVDRITIKPRSSDGKAESVITDRKRIEGLIDFVATRNRDWRKPWDTFPSGEYAVTLERNHETVLVLWISPGWIGGRDAGAGASENRLRDITAADWAELTELLQIGSSEKK